MRTQRLRIEPNTVLVAMINNKADHARLHEEKWYRIPVENAPEIIKNGKTKDKERYFLDFAIFCRDRHINVECDGDSYHDSPDQVHYDKDRNNELTAKGWSVLRYTTEQLLYKPERVMNKLMRTINKNGGVAHDGDVFLKLDAVMKNASGQLRLFE